MTNNTDPVRALIGEWREAAEYGVFTGGAGPGIRETFMECARELEAAIASAPRASAPAAVAAIQFALTDPEGMTFLRLWNEGEFDTLRREWPDAPSEVYVGADPLAAQHQEPTT